MSKFFASVAVLSAVYIAGLQRITMTPVVTKYCATTVDNIKSITHVTGNCAGYMQIVFHLPVDCHKYKDNAIVSGEGMDSDTEANEWIRYYNSFGITVNCVDRNHV